MRTWAATFFSTACLLALLSACAKPGRPSGGPVDRTAPRVVDHFPATDAISLGPDTRVDLVFSEAMDHSRTTEALFITPQVQVSHHWDGRRLSLHPLSPLQNNRTYIITLGTGARDRRGNNLDQSFTLAFATGAQLNQGRFSGHVFADHKPAKTVHVWAYALDRFNGRLGYDMPDYRTQSGSDGAYEFTRLSAGSYRLFAFVDNNRNQQWEPGEDHALPANDLHLDESQPSNAGDLALLPDPLAPPHLERAQSLHAGSLLLQFDRALDARTLEVAFDQLQILDQYNSPADSSKVYLHTGPQQGGQPYPFTRLYLNGQPLDWTEPVRGSQRSDRTAPTLARTYPGRKGHIAPDDTLRLHFSEPMQTNPLDSFWAASDSTQSPAGTWLWPRSSTALFVPNKPYSPGSYTLRGPGQRLVDLGGQPLETGVELSFTVLDTASSGRIEGRLLGLDEPDGPMLITVQAEGSQRSHTSRANAQGAFVFRHLPPGTYTLFGFADDNDNQVRDPGAPDPFQPSEPYAAHPTSLDLGAGQTLDEADLYFP
ncbi:MAG: hypothetical protein GKR89_08410 [Candidatus Latescibacteria bacterium]|nr:hypothetical protein [Candidatus Latescibacterota bacterium]